MLGLFGLGLGAIIRSSVGASLFCSGPLFVPSDIMSLLPASWQDTAGHYLPMNAGETIYTVQHQAHTLQPWAGFGVFSLYAAAAMPTAEAHVQTEHPSRYLAQLCKHARQVHRLRHRPPTHDGGDPQPPLKAQAPQTETDGIVSFSGSNRYMELACSRKSCSRSWPRSPRRAISCAPGSTKPSAPWAKG